MSWPCMRFGPGISCTHPECRPPGYDLSVSGSWGLYSILPQTPRGKRWLARHCSGGERTWLDGRLMCEGSREIRAIVAAADRARLRVEVNGVDMRGYGRGKDAA